MARMEYFGTFPTTKYDMGKDSKTRTVTDIMRRVGIRGDFINLLPTYHKRVLATDQRPEMAADHIYGQAKQHWVLMLLNRTVDPYYDWVIPYNEMDSYINLKYSNKVILLVSNHFIDSSYGAVDPTPLKRFFVKDEVVREYQADGTALDGVGTVISFDPTMQQITYSVTSGTFTASNYIKGDDSGAVGSISGVTIEREAIHHYENTDGIEVGRSTIPAPSEILNEAYEHTRNETNREILSLRDTYITQFEEEFAEKINPDE
tara:strand:+ start:1317 stop:2099 length:783 start_codon:yes stop_codon:yes gene_type:complete